LPSIPDCLERSGGFRQLAFDVEKKDFEMPADNLIQHRLFCDAVAARALKIRQVIPLVLKNRADQSKTVENGLCCITKKIFSNIPLLQGCSHATALP